jgi:FG-GAP-like repeat/FG-GAP repeat
MPDALIGDIASLVHVYPGDCHGDFADKKGGFQTYGMGDPVYGLAVADVNGDGKPDLITGGFPYHPFAGAGALAGNFLGVRLNDGTGHLGALTAFTGEPGMFSIVVADLKGNGHPEVLTANQDSNSVTVYHNDGSAGFGVPSGGYIGYLDGSEVGTANPMDSEFLVADVDGDGKADILQIQYRSGGSQALLGAVLTVLLNQGGGKFSRPVRSEVFTTGDFIGDYVVANFRNMGKGDFLAEISDQSNNFQPAIAFAHNGSGQFGAVTVSELPPYPGRSLPSGLGVGDFNGIRCSHSAAPGRYCRCGPRTEVCRRGRR